MRPFSSFGFRWFAGCVGAGVLAAVGCGDVVGVGLTKPRANADASADSGSGGGGTAGSTSESGGSAAGGRSTGGGSSSSCRDSRDCVGQPDNALICDRTTGRCVECVETTDCDPGSTCFGQHCRPPCTSDRQCTPMQLLCDPVAKVCAECVTDVDCPGDHCVAGVCTSTPSGTGGAGAGTGGASYGSGGIGAGGISNTGGRGLGGTSSGGSTGGQGGGCALFPVEKPCNGICVTPSPSNGCSWAACTPCPPAPANGVSVCNSSSGSCDFECLAGYAKAAGACVPDNGGTGGFPGTGGIAGTGGIKSSGGAVGTGGAGSCDPKKCTGCLPGAYVGCCKADGTCGCQLISIPTCN